MWRDAATDGLINASEASKDLTELYRSFLAGLHNYDIQCVIVEPGVAPSAIARIFERVNRTGMVLGTFDLMVARSYTNDFNLRDAWEEAQSRYPLLRTFFKDDGLAVLSVIALRERADILQRAVLNMPGQMVRDNWNTAVDDVNSAVLFLKELGVWRPEWLPYRNLVLVLAALSGDVELFQHEGLLKKWYWATVFGRRYDAASNTRAVADYRRLAQRTDPVSRPIFLIKETLLEATRRHYATLHRGFITAIAANKPLDVHTGESLIEPSHSELDSSNTIEAVSIFPKKHRQGAPILHLQTLGFVLARPSRGQDYLVGSLLGPTGECPSQFIANFDHADWSPSHFFEERLNLLREFLSEQLEYSVRIVSEEEIDPQ
jgi:hypothetical protein